MNAYFVYSGGKQENVLVCRCKNGFRKFTTCGQELHRGVRNTERGII